MSTKVSRRTVIKTIGLAGAALAATPYLAKASALGQLSGAQKGQSVATMAPPSGQSSAVPLVLYIKGDQILGYRGLEEIPLKDASLASMLNDTFRGASS